MQKANLGDTPRARGNALFVARDYEGAVAAYSEGISAAAPASPEEQALLLSNRAACHLELGDLSAAAKDARAAIVLQPCNAKAYYRLARALPRGNVDAAPSIASALALLSTSDRTTALRDLYKEVRLATSLAAENTGCSVLLQLPEDDSQLICAKRWEEVTAAVRRGTALVVLQPGIYNTQSCMALQGKIFSLLGLGDVELHSNLHHAAFATDDTIITLVNMRLVGTGQCAAACVACPTALLQLIHCRVVGYGEVGLLVVAGDARLEQCRFAKVARQAIEVREGGALVANGVEIVDCEQGISAYGGARSVILENSSITGTRKEGVLVTGTFFNAATEAQESLGKSSLQTLAQKVSAEATKRSKEQRTQLDAKVVNCSITKCGQFGISADNGARLLVQQCRLESNDPYSISIKGGTDATIVGCQVLYSGAASKSEWQSHASVKIKQGGINVGINYSGHVSIIGNAFAGLEELAILEDMQRQDLGRQAPKALQLKHAGMWSRPATAQKNSIVPLKSSASLPTVETLALNLSSGEDVFGGLQSRRRALASPPSTAALQRIHHTFPQAAWTPTGEEFYAIGNTFGFNLISERLPPADPQARILLGACGDVRNLLATVHAVESVPLGLEQLTIVMNDGNLSMLARNTALLHMAAELNAPAEAVLAVWSSHALSAAHASLLRESLGMLADEPWPMWLYACHSLDGTQGRAEAERDLRDVFRAWKSCTLPLKELLEQRDALLGVKERRAFSTQLSMTAVQAKLSKQQADQIRKEVKDYIESGSLHTNSAPLTDINPTFLLAPELQYTVYFSSSIFRAVPLGSGTTASSRLLRTLSPQLSSVAHALQRGTLTVALVPGDILTAMTSAQLPTSESKLPAGSHCPETDSRDFFDFIDCSNVSDYVSLTSLVQAAATLLVPKPHARLTFESITTYGAEVLKNPKLTPSEFVETQLSVSIPTFEHLLGLRFTGGVLVPGLRSALRLEWSVWEQSLRRNVPTECGSSWVTAPYLMLELLLTWKRLFAMYKPQAASISRSSSNRVSDFSKGSFLSLVHLLAVTFPQHTEGLLRALLRCEPSSHAYLFKWELTMHAQIQSGRCATLRRMTYKANPGVNLIGHDCDPILLAATRDPLPRGPVELGPPLKQIISSFAWDVEMATAYWMLPESIAEQCDTWYVTLCVMDAEKGLSAVGTSATIASLPAQQTDALPWRPLQPSHTPLHLAMDLIDQVGCSATGERTDWQGAVHCCPDQNSVTVDVLAPGALPPPEEAVVLASVEGSSFVVSVKPRGKSTVPEQSFTIQLPEGIASGQPLSTKVSRRLGLLSARVAMVECGVNK